jgi:hypothetical protein
MRIPRPEILKLFRGPGRCEACGKSCRIREAAHLFAKGMGGGGRKDIRINLVSLGSTPGFECQCHTNSHNGKEPTLDTLLGIVAEREKCKAEDIEPVIRFIGRLPKNASRHLIEYVMEAELPLSQQALAIKSLREAGVLK